jgi:2,3,4,5-tetrahydropyridine-2,6-dicarboxylate N-succinyltransferase
VTVGRSAWGQATATFDKQGLPLDYFFLEPSLGAAASSQGTTPKPSSAAENPVSGVSARNEFISIPDLDEPAVGVGDVYLRLHLLSHRLVRPNSINLDGIFAILPNVCWTSLGPVSPASIGEAQARARNSGLHLDIQSVDKFPKMLNYVVPSGVRIADGARVRLGAYLSEGTTVMHEGFVNFNAGTLGACMVEGRISQGVIVGANSDVGGGASIMGMLSGGGKEVISIGERCLLGANSGLGISLGDDCVVEAGLYLTSGTVVSLEDHQTVKARDLSGQSGFLYRRNSVTGTVEALRRPGMSNFFNAQLHQSQ